MVTYGNFALETQAESAIMSLLQKSALFSVYNQVNGFMMQPRPFSEPKPILRIDHILVPTKRLMQGGWNCGFCGLEVKRSTEKAGRPIAQCQDYQRCLFDIGGNRWLAIRTIFIFPLEKQNGVIASVMAQNRIGNIVNREDQLTFYSGEVVLLRVFANGEFVCNKTEVGNHTGAR